MTNVRCHDNLSLDISPANLTLISGESGSGKSSIFEAIEWVITGKKAKNFYKYKTKETIVELEDRNWIITRKRGNGKISVIDENKKEYIEDSAQQLLNARYGDNFLITSYIKQGISTSFINLTPSNKQLFLEQLAFGTNADEIVDRCKAEIKSIKNLLIEEKAKRETLSSELDSLTKPIEQKNPFSVWKQEKFSSAKKKLEQYNSKVSIYEPRMVELRAKLVESKTIEQQRNNLLAEQQENQKVLNKLLEEKSILEKQVADSPEELERIIRRIQSLENSIHIKRSSLKDYHNAEAEWNQYTELNKQLSIETTKLASYKESFLKLSNIDQKQIQEAIKYVEEMDNYKRLLTSYKNDKISWEATKVIEVQQINDDIAALQTIPIIADQTKILNDELISWNQAVKLKERINELEKELDKFDSISVITKQAETLKEMTIKIREDIITAKQEACILFCPSCNKSLRMENSGLVLTEKPKNSYDISQLQRELSDTEKKRSKVENDINTINTLTKQLNKFKEELNKLKIPPSDPSEQMENHKQALFDQQLRKNKIINLQNRLKTEQWSTTALAQKTRLESKEREVSSFEKRLSTIKSSCDESLVSLTIEELRTSLENAKIADERSKNLEANIKNTAKIVSDIKARMSRLTNQKPNPELLHSLEIDLKNLEDSLQKLTEKYGDILHIEQRLEVERKLSEYIKQKNNEIHKTESKVQQINKNLSQLPEVDQTLHEKTKEVEEKHAHYSRLASETRKLVDQCVIYERYLSDYNRYKELANRVSKAAKSEENASDELCTAERLLEIIRKCQGESVRETMDHINTNIRYYLEKFFQNGIKIQLSNTKETKTGSTKNIINMNIVYKGNDIDICDLSGGERARVEVALCLALNGLVDSKILILDESLASLDSDTVETITEVLKNESISQGKTIICVLHQTNEGSFDRVIKIE